MWESGPRTLYLPWHPGCFVLDGTGRSQWQLFSFCGPLEKADFTKEPFMKARIIFYCVVIAVLLATLAAIPSHAFERRNPLLNQEISAASGSGHPDSAAAKPTQSGSHAKKPSPAHPAQTQAKNKIAPKKNDSSSNKTASR